MKYFILPLILIGLFIGFQNSSSGEEINIAGSTSMQPVCEQLVEAYEKNHSDVRINVQGGGSNLGIKSVNADIADIGMCSKHVNDSGLKQYELGREGIVIAVNPSNNITDLSVREIRMIFNGTVTNWKDLGGENAPINVYVREEGSGTLDAFKSIIMNNSRMKKDSIVFNSQGSLKQAITGDVNAIGFVSYSYLDDTISPVGVDGIYPADESIADGSYPIQRPFLLLFKEDCDFIGWLDGGEADSILQENRIIR